MVAYISEPGSFMGTDILTKNTSLKELKKNFQRLLDDGTDLNKMDLLDRKFKPFRFKAEQKTSDCIMVSFKTRSFFLEGVL